VTGAIGTIGIVALMIWLNWGLFLIVAGLVAAGGLIVLSVVRGIRAASLRSQQYTGEMSSDLERALSAIRTIRASRAEQREFGRIGDQARSVYASSVRMAKLDAVVGPASELAVGGSFLVVLLIGGLQLASGRSSVGGLVAFLLYMTYLAMPIGSLFEAVSAMQQGTGALQRINEVLALPPEGSGTRPGLVALHQQDRAMNDQADGGHLAAVLEFRGVWFGYDAQQPVLRGVSFQVPRYSRVALIGVSGAGKSTIFALAERFYDPDRGQVLFFGRDVRGMRRTEYRARIGLVEQHCPCSTARSATISVTPPRTPTRTRSRG
jgi:ABC-type multidrug transport system fused ATPase/permease subunit